jgi:hypothetical protein
LWLQAVIRPVAGCTRQDSRALLIWIKDSSACGGHSGVGAATFVVQRSVIQQMILLFSGTGLVRVNKDGDRTWCRVGQVAAEQGNGK